MDFAMAQDVIIHGDFVQFQAAARCDACQTRDLKCALQESDDGCMACAGASRECIFTRTVTVAGPKALYSWGCFIAQEPGLLRLNAPTGHGRKPDPIIFNPGPSTVTRPLQTPAPSSTRLSIGELPSPAVPRLDEEHPHHVRPDYRAPSLAAAAGTPTTVTTITETVRPPNAPGSWIETTPRRRASSPYSETSPRRRGIDPSQRGSIGQDLAHSLAEQDQRNLVERKNSDIMAWLDRGSAAGTQEDPYIAQEQDQSDSRPSTAAHTQPLPEGLRELRPMPSPSTLSPSGPESASIPGALGEPFTPGLDRPESPPVSASLVFNEPPQSAGLLTIEAHPWIEPLRFPSIPTAICQPPTSNAAMVRYQRASGMLEPLSRAASKGSLRDMVEAELESLTRHPSLMSRLSIDAQSVTRIPPQIHVPPTFPRPLQPPLISPSGNRAIKPKPSMEFSPNSDIFAGPLSSYAESSASDAGRRSTFPKQTPINTAPPRWASVNNSPGTAKRMSRNRSLSSRASRSNLDESALAEASFNAGLSSEDLPPESLEATYDSFRARIRSMVPRIEDFLLERLAKEQFNRYKSLVELKAEHAKQRDAGRCPSGAHCTESFQFRRANGGATGDEDPTPTQSTEDGVEAGYVVEPALFGPGIPIPPAKRLPAEFECPFCFQVRNFQKPSDWSKHIQEDVAPFICTFPHCPEPKSFKRKADWVRHENERHRQLEWWQCNKEGCSHICYRRDNFVQHLVREHKMAEPKPKANSTGGGTPSGRGAERATSSKHSAEEQVIKMVDACRRETTKNPAEEPCRFCGHQCNAFKKLTVHLARHMEVISLPILELVARSDKDGPAAAAAAAAAAVEAEAQAQSPKVEQLPRPRHISPINVIVPLDRNHTWHSEREPGGGGESAISPHTMPPITLPMSGSTAIRGSISNGATVASAPTAPAVAGDGRASQPLPDKPFRCTATGCTHDRGFATQNDLNRHMKGVHGIYHGSSDLRYFKCQGKDCSRESKQWPRLDNFRGHVARMHPDEDAEDLIQRSTFTASESIPASGDSGTEQLPDSEKEETKVEVEEVKEEESAQLAAA